MRNLLLSCLLGSFIFPVAYSQLSGRVVDAHTGAALEGATISSDLGLKTTSNEEGFFLIQGNYENSRSLQFSYLGYQTKVIEIAGKNNMGTVVLEPGFQTIGELVVAISGLPVSLLKSTASISSLTPRNLQVHNGIVLNDAINQVPGLYMSGGGYNTNRLTIRGIGSRSPYSSNRIRAYLDDIPLTSGDGSTSIEDIDIAAISRIEVLKGPSSAVYGSGLGGAVRMWSYQPEDDKFSLSLSSEAGSFGTFRSFIRGGYKSSGSAVSLVYSNSHSDGFRQNSRYNRNSFLFTASQSRNKTGLKLSLLYTGVDARIASSVTRTSFNADPQLAAPNWLAVKGFEKYQKFLLGLTAETQINQNITNKLSVFGSFSDPFESRPFNILDEKSASAGVQEQIHFSAGRFDFLAGGEAFLEGFNWKIFETAMGLQGDLLADNREKRFYLNTFALSRFKPGDHFTAEFGLNMNILHYSLEDYFREDSLDLGGKYSYAPVVSPRLGINYRPGNGMNFHASLGHGFSAPSLEETLLPDGQVNTALKPETGWNYDAGIRGNAMGNRLNYDITFYHIALSNLLVTQRISEEIFSGINAGKTSHTGIESMLRLNLLSPETAEKQELTFTTSFTASINRFKDFSDNNTDFSGKKLPGIPSAVLYNELRLKVLKSIEFTAIYKFTGKQFMNDANTEENESWKIADLRLAYTRQYGEKHHRIRIYGGVRNLFDKHYAGMILVNAPSFGTAEPRYYYPGLPRNYFGGMVLEFN